MQQCARIVSDDLQEPLRAVSGYMELLRRCPPLKTDDNAREFIDGAAEGVSRLKSMITGLVEYTRAGECGLSFEDTDLRVPLEIALNRLALEIQNSGAKITAEPLPSLKIDPARMAQLFQNLIGNAIKFRGGAPPEIHIGSRQTGDVWLLSVTDNGIGIDPEQAGRVFGLFQRLQPVGSYAGAGAGLAVCRRIVERHRGKIWVESEPGHGATFFFTLPLARPEQGAVEPVGLGMESRR